MSLCSSLAHISSLSLSLFLFAKHNRRLSSSAAQVLSNRLKISFFFFFCSSFVAFFISFPRSVTQSTRRNEKKTLQVLSRPKNRRLFHLDPTRNDIFKFSLYKRLRKKKKNDSSDVTFSILDLFRPRASAIKSWKLSYIKVITIYICGVYIVVYTYSPRLNAD